MKSYNNLYEQMLRDDYIKQCFKDASKKKKNRNDVKEVLENIDRETEVLKKMLREEMFIPDYHRQSVINDGNRRKIRIILKPHYKYEQVVHHCAIGQFKQVVMNGLYEFSCGSIPGRGVHYGKKYIRKWIDSYNGKKMYVLKMDVHHFFESMDREILKEKLRNVIRDKRFLRLLYTFVEHDRIAEVTRILENAAVEISQEGVKDLVTFIAFHNDNDTMAIIRKTGITGSNYTKAKQIVREYRKGVPLGYFSSQWFGNFYLKKLDHFIKETLKAEHYMRYMDDMVILGKSKKSLHKIQKEMERYLKDSLGLELKRDWQIFRFEYISKDGMVRGRMLDFMGFQFHYNRTTIRKTTIESARKKAYHIAKNEKISWYNATVMLSYLGWFRHTDTYGYYLKYIKPNVNVKKLKKIVSKHSRKENERHDRMENTEGNAV
ncbi:RNA-directed DNA polymerase [Eisenbergiella sp.]